MMNQDVGETVQVCRLFFLRGGNRLWTMILKICFNWKIHDTHTFKDEPTGVKMETHQLIFLNTAGGVLGFCWLIGWCLISLFQSCPLEDDDLHRPEAGSLTFFAQARCRASRWWHRHCCGTNSPCGSNTGPLNQQEPGVWLGWVRVSVFNYFMEQTFVCLTEFSLMTSHRCRMPCRFVSIYIYIHIYSHFCV